MHEAPLTPCPKLALSTKNPALGGVLRGFDSGGFNRFHTHRVGAAAAVKACLKALPPAAAGWQAGGKLHADTERPVAESLSIYTQTPMQPEASHLHDLMVNIRIACTPNNPFFHKGIIMPPGIYYLTDVKKP